MSEARQYIEHVDPPQNSDKGWIEYGLQLLWSEMDGYEHVADNAGLEIVELRAEHADLLEALDFIVEQITNENNAHHTLGAYAHGAGIDMAKKAIAKARGEA